MRPVVLSLIVGGASAGFINSGTPAGVPVTSDCALRQLAWEYGKSLRPDRGDFTSLFDALQLHVCNLTRPSTQDAWSPASFDLPSDTQTVIYADAQGGLDSNDGNSPSTAVQSLEHAIALSRDSSVARPVAVVLSEGTYFLSGTIELTAEDSDLIIQNAPGERASISGGVALEDLEWAPYGEGFEGWQTFESHNAVYGKADAKKNNSATQYLGDFSSAEDCGAAAAAAGQLAWSWHDPSFGSDDFASSCFAIIDGSWQLTPEEGTVCAYWARSNTHVAELQSLNLFPTGSFNGLRVDGRRAVRARYPDGDPEKLGGAFSSQDASMGDGSCISSPIHPSLRYPSI